MRKVAKKLQLNVESVRELTVPDLQLAVGGSNKPTCMEWPCDGTTDIQTQPPNCPASHGCSSYSWCTVCSMTC